MSPTTAEDSALIALTSSRWWKSCLPVLGLGTVLIGSLTADLAMGPRSPTESPPLQAEATAPIADIAPPELHFRTLRNGSYAAGLEARARTHSWVRYHLAPVGRMALWRTLCLTHPELTAGPRGWLFTTRRTGPAAAWNEDQALEILAVHRALARRFELFGQRLSFVLLPTKATAVPERLFEASQGRPDRYARWVERYRAEGFASFEALSALQTLGPDDRWWPRDTHWSSQAQEVVARHLAEGLRPLLAQTSPPTGTTLGAPELRARDADLLRYGGMLEAEPNAAPDYGPPESLRIVQSAAGQPLPLAPVFEIGAMSEFPHLVVAGTSFMASRPFAAYLGHFLEVPVANAAKPATGSERPLAPLLDAAASSYAGPAALVLVDLLQHVLDKEGVDTVEALESLTRNPPPQALELGSWRRDAAPYSALGTEGVTLQRVRDGATPRSLFRTTTALDLFCDGSGVAGYEVHLDEAMAGESAALYRLEDWPMLPLPGDRRSFTVPILRRRPASYSALSLPPRLMSVVRSVSLVLDVGDLHPEPLRPSVEMLGPDAWRLALLLPFVTEPALKPCSPAVLFSRPDYGAAPIVTRLRYVYSDGHSVTREAHPTNGQWKRLLALAPPNRLPARPAIIVVEGTGSAPRLEGLRAALFQSRR